MYNLALAASCCCHGTEIIHISILPPPPPQTPPSVSSDPTYSSPHRDAKPDANAKPHVNTKPRTNAVPQTKAKSPDCQYTSESPLISLLKPPPTRPQRRLPRILPTRHINSKRYQLLLFTIVDVTAFKEAIAAAINLDPDLNLNLNTN